MIRTRREEIRVDADRCEMNPCGWDKSGEELRLLGRDYRDPVHRVHDVTTNHVDEHIRRLMVSRDSIRAQVPGASPPRQEVGRVLPVEVVDQVRSPDPTTAQRGPDLGL